MKFVFQTLILFVLSLLRAGTALGQASSSLGAANALALSGGGHIVATNAPVLSHAFTFEAWVRLSGTTGHQTIVSRGEANAPTSPTDYIFQVLPGGLVGVFAAGAWNYSAQALISADTWTHLAATFDGTEVRFYRNGTLRHRAPRVGSLQLLGDNEPLFLGRQGSACNCNFLNGQLDEVRIWSVARSDDEIAVNYARSLFGNEIGLAALFRFDESGGAMLVNGANFNAPGTLIGTVQRVASGAGFADAPPRAGIVVTPLSNGDATLRGTILCGSLPTSAWAEASTNADFSFSLHSAPETLSSEFDAIVVPVAVPPGQWLVRIVASNALGLATAEAGLESLAFVNVPVTGLGSVRDARVAWGQLDNGGGPEFLVSGNPLPVPFHNQLQCWRNTSLGFVRNAAPNPQSTSSQGRSDWVVLADYDNDGWLDVLYTAMQSNGLGGVQLWRNDRFQSAPTFQRVSVLGTGSYGAVAWADIDNDGRQDFLATGSRRSFVAELWQNRRSDFVSIPLNGVPGVDLGDVTWADYDSDGWLDFILLGEAEDTSLVTQLWRNTGHGFSNVTATAFPPDSLPGVKSGAAAWADYDNDGRLDFLLTGSGTARLWRNTGAGFTNVPVAGLAGVEESAVAWADYDNDGWRDFIYLGKSPGGPITQLWRNTGTNFVGVPVPGLQGVQNGSVAWGDYDNDGGIDFLIAGSGLAQIWRNRTRTHAFAVPSAPTGLAMTTTANGVMFSWSAATHARTPASGLSYNVRAGTRPGGIDLISPHANPASGIRRLFDLGNAQMRRFMFLTGVTNGQTVYWSVQAVNTSFGGGPWASETSVVSQPQLAITPALNGLTRVSWAPPTSGWCLQENSQLTLNSWSNTPSGGMNPTLLPVTGDHNKFYRLIKP